MPQFKKIEEIVGLLIAFWCSIDGSCNKFARPDLRKKKCKYPRFGDKENKSSPECCLCRKIKEYRDYYRNCIIFDNYLCPNSWGTPKCNVNQIGKLKK